MSKLEEIKARIAEHEMAWLDELNRYDIDWMIIEIETLRAAAHGDQIVIQRLRREYGELNEVAHLLYQERDALAAKLAQIEQDDEVRQQFKWYCITCMERFYFEGDCPICLGRLVEDGGTMTAKLAQAQQRAVSQGGRVPR